MNTKKMAMLIAEMLDGAIAQHPCLDSVSREDLKNVFAERANNIAQAMPHLLDECRDLRQTPEQAYQQTQKYTSMAVAGILGLAPGFGVEPGESL